MPELVATLVGLATVAALFRVFFSGMSDFLDAVRFWFTPNILSLFRGESTQDWWAEMKLALWIGSGIAAGMFTHAGLTPDTP